MSTIVHSTVEDRPLTESELLGISHLLLLGGLDTVTATLDCMVVYLATHPEQRKQLVDDPSLIPAAIEELLRWLTPVMMIPRSIKQDCEMEGVQLQAGDSVMLAIGAANGDRSEFPDPSVDFERNPNRHVAFGGSNHSLSRSAFGPFGVAGHPRRTAPADPRLPDPRRRGHPFLPGDPTSGSPSARVRSRLKRPGDPAPPRESSRSRPPSRPLLPRPLHPRVLSRSSAVVRSARAARRPARTPLQQRGLRRGPSRVRSCRPRRT